MEQQAAGAGSGRELSRLEMRVSDADRHRVAELLREAAGEGRIDLDELDERLEAAYAAKTYGDLVPLTSELPVGAADRPAPPVVRRQTPPATVAHESSLAVLGDCTRRGAWVIPERHTAFALMGGVTLDLREATFTAQETTIVATAIMAGVEIIVDAQTHVVVEGVGIMGDFSQSKDKVPALLTPESPVVRVKGLALMSGVSVVRKGPPGPAAVRRVLGRGDR